MRRVLALGALAALAVLSWSQVTSIPAASSSSGGGPSITQGTWANLPVTCTANDLYLETDNVFLAHSRCSASNTWSHFVLGGQLLTTIAASLAMTSSLQGGTTVSAAHGYEAMTVPISQTGNAYSFRYWTAPSTPYTQYVYMRFPARVDSLMYQATAVGFTTGTRLFGIECGSELDGATSYDCRSFLWNGGTYGSFPSSFPVTPPANGGVFVWGLGDDGTNLHLGLSTDGGNSFLDILPTTSCTAAGFTSCAAITSHFYGGWNSTTTLGTPIIMIGIK